MTTSRSFVDVTLWTLTVFTFTNAVIGCLVYLYYVDHRSPDDRNLTNPYMGLWSCFLLAFFSMQSLILQSPDPQPSLAHNGTVRVHLHMTYTFMISQNFFYNFVFKKF